MKVTAKMRAENPTFLNEYLTNIQIVKGCLDRTVFAYYIDIRMFLRYILWSKTDLFPDIPLEEIPIKSFNSELLATVTKSEVYDYLQYMSDQRHNGPIARARIVSSLRSLFKYLKLNTTILISNPMENIEMHKPKQKMIKYLTLEQSIELLDSIDTSHFERDFCIITLFLNCGMRLSELVGLNISDINFKEKTMLIHGKGNKDRIIYINDACISTIKEYLSSRENSEVDPDAIFLSTHKKRISRRRVEQIVEKALNDAGLGNMGFSVHKLRHTSATLMYQHGKTDTLVLKEILGHSNIATTEIYTHTSNEQIKEAIDTNPLAEYKPIEPELENNEDEKDSM